MDPLERPSRLTRDARRAQTRERLLDAAAEVFNRLGYHGASLEAVAESAGYTKGAVYSNFDSKVDLFLALAERRSISASIDARREEIIGTPLEEFIDGMGESLRAQAAQEEAWDVLTIEVWLAAMRDGSLRSVIAHDYRQMREELGPLIAAKLDEAGIDTPFTAEELGGLVSAVGSGLILQHYIEPGAVDAELLPRAMRQLLGLPPKPAATESAAAGGSAPAEPEERAVGLAEDPRD